MELVAGKLQADDPDPVRCSEFAPARGEVCCLFPSVSRPSFQHRLQLDADRMITVANGRPAVSGLRVMALRAGSL